jgi:hypothetical protein
MEPAMHGVWPHAVGWKSWKMMFIGGKGSGFLGKIGKKGSPPLPPNPNSECTAQRDRYCAERTNADTRWHW